MHRHWLLLSNPFLNRRPSNGWLNQRRRRRQSRPKFRAKNLRLASEAFGCRVGRTLPIPAKCTNKGYLSVWKRKSIRLKPPIHTRGQRQLQWNDRSPNAHGNGQFQHFTGLVAFLLCRHLTPTPTPPTARQPNRQLQILLRLLAGRADCC